jgi:chitinase
MNCVQVFISFDNEQAINDKIAYIKEKGLGGAMYWMMGQDDPDNTLLTTIYNGLNSSP